jgi:hypothetical protein
LRPYETRTGFLRAVADGGYDLLLLGKASFADVCHLPGARADEDGWAHAAGYRRVAESDRLVVYEVTGRVRR